MKKSNNLYKLNLLNPVRVIVYSLIFLTVNLSACQRKEQENNNIIVRQTGFEDNFIVQLEVIAENEDSFDFFFVLDSLNEKFTETKKMRKKINGKGKLEIVCFELEGQKALKFRIDLGRNEMQKGILIRSIEVKHNSKALFIKGGLIKYFFNENRYMQILDNGEVLFKSAPRRTPFMNTSALLNKKMKIEF
tara:strand:- start:5279 stop:5851 length:573 start_codon:yes stop_codon:yes gene_type:complete